VTETLPAGAMADDDGITAAPDDKALTFTPAQLVD
jgi:hypothetical protein